MLAIKDPNQTRKVKEIPLPYCRSLAVKDLFQGKMINLVNLIDFYKLEGVLSEQLVKQIISMGESVLRMQANLIYMDEPVNIVGDIHGQYYDLINILRLKGMPSRTNKYLFLGDYVDRGFFSIQVMILVTAMKINWPKYVFLLRGNHESQQLTTFFNFRAQCLEYYSQEIYEKFVQLFCCLPLAAVVNRRFMCIHGGISTNIHSIEDIMRINRFKQIPQNGLFCDLVWADPIDNSQGSLKGLVVFNEVRCCSYNFGFALVRKVLQANKLACIIRAHEAKHWAGLNSFPPVITLFSAPNYCDFYNNKGAVITIKNNLIEINQISGSPHPFYLPNNKTLFEWSIPFIAEKVTQMFHFLLLSDCKQEFHPVTVEQIKRNKIIQLLMRIQKEEAKQNMQYTKLHGKLLAEQLLGMPQARDYAMNIIQKDFNFQKQIDKINQKRPQNSEIQDLGSK